MVINVVEKLYEAIATKNAHIVEMMDVFGDDYWYVKNQILIVDGMKDAFEIIAGCSYTNYLLTKVNEEFNYAQ